LYTLQRHTAAIWNLKFDQSRLVSSSFDQSVLVWDFGGLESISREQQKKWGVDSASMNLDDVDE
jgi:hypothetical protein